MYMNVSITMFFAQEHNYCHAKCSLILKSLIAAILFSPSSAEENLRKSRNLSSDGRLNIRGGKNEKTPRKTDSRNTGYILGAKKIPLSFAESGESVWSILYLFQ